MQHTNYESNTNSQQYIDLRKMNKHASNKKKKKGNKQIDTFMSNEKSFSFQEPCSFKK